jgi:O-antigen/teichoic acid export membrane protein
MVSKLGASGRGDTAAVLAATYVTPFLLSLGIVSSVRFYAGKSDFDSAINLSRVVSLISLPVSVIIGIGLISGPLNSLTGDVKILAILNISFCSLSLLWYCYEAALSSSGRYLSVSSLGLLIPGTNLIGLILSNALQCLTVQAVLITNLISVAITVLWANQIIRVKVRKATLSASLFFAMGIKSWGAEVAEIAASKLDQLFLLAILGSQALGVYSIAATVSAIPLTVGYALSARTYTLVLRADDNSQDRILREVFWAGIIWGCFSAICVAVSAPLIPFVFGSQFNGAVLACVFAGLGVLGSISSKLTTSSLMAIDRPFLATASRISGLAVSLGLIPWLAGDFGVLGAVFASNTGFFVSLGLSIYFLKIHKNSNPQKIRLVENSIKIMFGRDTKYTRPES